MPMKTKVAGNEEIAATLDHVADLLELERASGFRVRSYRQAAQTIRDLDTPVRTLLKQDGEHLLQDLPGIGAKLAGSIREIATTGRLGLAERLEHETWPGQLFTEVPGIGEELARRIHEQLGISTLEELEVAAHEGRLEQVEGIGPERAEGVRVVLAGMLSQSSRRKLRQALGDKVPTQEDQERPSVDLLLEIDAEYRGKAERDQLRKIAPKRFNPQGEAWLPLLKTERQGWSFTALFSNTATAHRQGKTHDWVVIYYERAGEQQQGTVVTAERGKLAGRRIVRGRERECREHYGV
jgi:Holliday junction resolvasome RuvABC DNA-binding subunit